MKFNTTFRSFNGSVYVLIPAIIEDNWKLKKLLERYEKENKKPECILEDIKDNRVVVNFPKW